MVASKRKKARAFPATETRRNDLVFEEVILFMCERICNRAMIPKHATCPLNNP